MSVQPTCPKCGAPVPFDHMLCAGCHEPIDQERPRIGAVEASGLAPPDVDEMAVIRRYLPPQLATKILASRDRVDGERRQVTVLFADMHGYTPLAEALGEELVYELMGRVYEYMITPVHAEEGTVQDLAGDGILALFGAPTAIEDAPLRACRAALAIQANMHVLADEFARQHGVRPQVRIGIHTGPVVVGTVGSDLRTEYKAVGDTVNLAARLESMATPGTILLSSATNGLVEGYVRSTFAGEYVIKGKGKRQQIYCLDSIVPGVARFDVSRRRGLSPLVDREHELHILDQCWHHSQQYNLNIVEIVGEAGIGKTRLLHECQTRATGLFLQGRCTRSGRSRSFLPFIEIVRSLFGIIEGESHRAVRRKLEEGLKRQGPQLESILPFLLVLLGVDADSGALRGLDSKIIGDRTRDGLQALLREWSRQIPLVIVVEDLHWIDSASEYLLLKIAQTKERSRILLLCSYRPPYRGPWNRQGNVTVLDLPPLSDRSIISIVEHHLGVGLVPDKLAPVVIERAGGNPLFAEELTRYLRDGTARDVDDSARFAHHEVLHIPATVQALILARVDRLPDGPRRILQVASVLGRHFPLDLLKSVCETDLSLEQHLQALELHELIGQKGPTDDAECYFTHSLIQDAVYGSLLTHRRQELHERVAKHVEDEYRGGLSEWAEVLAYHWSQTTQRDKAAWYLVMSAKKSLRVYALEEAHQHVQHALELLAAMPDTPLLADIILTWARVYYYQNDFKGLTSLIERDWQRVEAVGNKRCRSLLRFWLGYAHGSAGRRSSAITLLEEALALGEELDDPECIGYACMGLMWVHTYWIGHSDHPLEIVQQLGIRALGIAEQIDDAYLRSKCILCLAIEGLLHSRFPATRGACSKLLELGQRYDDTRITSMGLWALAYLNVYELNYEAALDHAEEALRLSAGPIDRLSAEGAKGAALSLMGRSQEGVRLLKQARDEMVEREFLYPLAGVDIPYGAAMVLAGDIAVGIRMIEEAMERFAQWGNDTNPTFGHMILGEIYLQMAVGQEKPPVKVLLRNMWFLLRTLPVAARKAEKHLKEASRRARATEMPGFLAQILLDLGKLYKFQNRPVDARHCLEEAQQIAERLESSLLSARICKELRF